MACRIRKHAALALALAACAAAAQDDGLTRPPRVDAPVADDLTRAPRLDEPGRTEERPGAARLAEPPRREAPVEEVVVVGEQRWRLPDLGSEWRQREQQRAAANARIRTEFFRVYDPNDQTRWTDPFPVNSDMRRVGFIEVFRLRFGGRR